MMDYPDFIQLLCTQWWICYVHSNIVRSYRTNNLVSNAVLMHTHSHKVINSFICMFLFQRSKHITLKYKLYTSVAIDLVNKIIYYLVLLLPYINSILFMQQILNLIYSTYYQPMLQCMTFFVSLKANDEQNEMKSEAKLISSKKLFTISSLLQYNHARFWQITIFSSMWKMIYSNTSHIELPLNSC